MGSRLKRFYLQALGAHAWKEMGLATNAAPDRQKIATVSASATATSSTSGNDWWRMRWLELLWHAT